MYNVLLVDDEAIIRSGLKRIIKWENMECQICGEASNGIEAIEKVTEYHPDIMMVDMKMPGMNGIELIENIKEIVPKCKIIILSGYRDFEYMQSAIKLGAFDYIIKPSKVDVIEDVIKRAVKKIHEDEEEEIEINKLKNSTKSFTSVLQNKLIYELMTNKEVDKESIKKEIDICNLTVCGYRVVTLVASNQGSEDVSNNFKALGDVLSDYLEDVGSIRKIDFGTTKIVYILECKEDDLIDGDIRTRLNKFIKMSDEYYKVDVVYGLSSYSENLFDMSNLYDETICEIDRSLGKSSKKNIIGDINSGDKVLTLNVKKTVEYINKHFNENITLNDMAEQNKISPYYLSRIFTKETGKNFVEYLNTIRIEKAKSLLLEDKYKYYEIAEMVGISDSHYFSKIFKKYTGFTPSQFKNNIMKNA